MNDTWKQDDRQEAFVRSLWKKRMDKVMRDINRVRLIGGVLEVAPVYSALCDPRFWDEDTGLFVTLYRRPCAPAVSHNTDLVNHA